jgi:cell division septation protein DedD
LSQFNVLLSAIVIALSTIFTPLLIARQSFKRQDEVAARLDHSDKEINTKLDTIHTLVNSNMTAAMQSEFDATVRELAMMLEVIELKKSGGLDPSVDAKAAVEITQLKIAELKAQLEDRYKSTELADQQAR